MNWTIAAIERVITNGLTPGLVVEALDMPPRLSRMIDDDMVGYVTRAANGKLIEVWCEYSEIDDELEVWTAFEAGAVSQARWKSVFGEEQ